MACVACHGAGVAGAPKYGDKAAWGPRLAKGADTLHEHAIEGFQGQAGFMPPKGGRVDLSDKSIMNAVDYMMAARSKPHLPVAGSGAIAPLARRDRSAATRSLRSPAPHRSRRAAGEIRNRSRHLQDPMMRAR